MKLGKLAEEVEYPYDDMLWVILKDVEESADIGVRQGCDEPSDSKNAPSTYTAGPHISDAIYKMIKVGFVMGPFIENDLPFSRNRFSGVM